MMKTHRAVGLLLAAGALAAMLGCISVKQHETELEMERANTTRAVERAAEMEQALIAAKADLAKAKGAGAASKKQADEAAKKATKLDQQVAQMKGQLQKAQAATNSAKSEAAAAGKTRSTSLETDTLHGKLNSQASRTCGNARCGVGSRR